MTDREALLALLDRFGLAAYEGGDSEVKAPGSDEVMLLAHHGGVVGFTGFRATFTFDADGAFKDLGIWE